MGFTSVTRKFDVAERAAGGSLWSLRRLMSFAVDGLASFTVFPLLVSGYLGAALALPESSA